MALEIQATGKQQAITLSSTPVSSSDEFNELLFDFNNGSKITTDEQLEQFYEVEDVNFKSAVLPNFIGSIVDFFDKNTKDGKISETKQGLTGDCFLLAGVNALSHTEAGKKIISEALEYQEGYTLVHLKGCGTVKIDDSDVIRTKGSFQYASGDDDMIIFELAIQKVIDDILNNECVYDYVNGSSNWEDVQHKTHWLFPSISGGTADDVMNYITGKETESFYDYDEMKDALSRFEQNKNKDFALSASCHEKCKVKDIYGKKVKLYSPHAYSIKEVKDGVVTLINPWNSSEDIKLEIDVVCKKFDCIYGVDLSENGASEQFVSRKYKYDSDGNKVFIFDNPYKEVKLEIDPETGKKISREDKEFNSETGLSSSSVLVKYDLKTGKKIFNQTISYDTETGLPSYADITEKSVKTGQIVLSKYISYNSNGEISFTRVSNYNEDKKCTTKVYDSDDNLIEETNYEYDKKTGKEKKAVTNCYSYYNGMKKIYMQTVKECDYNSQISVETMKYFNCVTDELVKTQIIKRSIETKEIISEETFDADNLPIS